MKSLHPLQMIVLALLFVGAISTGIYCYNTPPSAPSTVAKEAVASSFPHHADWESPASHGSWVRQYGWDQCTVCHAATLTTEPRKGDCATCHALYPHTAAWVKKENHGAEATKNGTAECATLCHGSDMNGGLSNVSCVKCHSITPHAENWAQPDQHGEEAKGDGKTVCMNCHGNDLAGGFVGVSCTQCHEVYPHSATWSDGDVHGTYVTFNGQGKCETTCHGADLNGGLSGVVCSKCHGDFKHPFGWIDHHGATVKQLGKESCKACHGQDFKALQDGKNCYSCHSDYPHPDEATWIPFIGGHGEAVQVTHGGSFTSCQPCHGTDLKTKEGGRNCFSCHPAFPHSFFNSQWATYAGHGAYTLGATRTECQLCHGTDYKGGIFNTPSCFGCHPAYPHLEGWYPAVTGALAHWDYVSQNGTTSCATQYCHGVDLTPTADVTQGPDCTTCHATSVHTDPNWATGAMGRTANAHAIEYVSEINSGNTIVCTSCHGTNYDTLLGTVRCTNAACHPSGVTHRPGWEQGSGHGNTFLLSDTATTFSSSRCADCHGSAILFSATQSKATLTAQASCYGCHPAFPHIGYVSSGWRRSHYSYINARPAAFTDAAGAIPISTAPLALLPAIINSCGGNQSGSCHYNPAPPPNPSNCHQYCH